MLGGKPATPESNLNDLLLAYGKAKTGTEGMAGAAILQFIGDAPEEEKTTLVQTLLKDEKAVFIINVLNLSTTYKSSNDDALHNFLKAFIATKEAKEFFLKNDLSSIFNGLFAEKSALTDKGNDLKTVLNNNGWRETFYQKLTTLAEGLKWKKPKLDIFTNMFGTPTLAGDLKGKKPEPNANSVMLRTSALISTLAEMMAVLEWMTTGNKDIIFASFSGIALASRSTLSIGGIEPSAGMVAAAAAPVPTGAAAAPGATAPTGAAAAAAPVPEAPAAAPGATAPTGAAAAAAVPGATVPTAATAVTAPAPGLHAAAMLKRGSSERGGR